MRRSLGQLSVICRYLLVLSPFLGQAQGLPGNYMQVQTVDAAAGVYKVRVEVLEDGNNFVFALADTRSVQVELLRKRDNFRLGVNGFMAFAELPQLTCEVVSLPAAARQARRNPVRIRGATVPTLRFRAVHP